MLLVLVSASVNKVGVSNMRNFFDSMLNEFDINFTYMFLYLNLCTLAVREGARLFTRGLVILLVILRNRVRPKLYLSLIQDQLRVLQWFPLNDHFYQGSGKSYVTFSVGISVCLSVSLSVLASGLG